MSCEMSGSFVRTCLRAANQARHSGALRFATSRAPVRSVRQQGKSMFIKRNIQTLREWWQSPVTIKERAVGALVGGIEASGLVYSVVSFSEQPRLLSARW